MNTSPEERKEILHLSLRQILDSFPVIGPILNNIFFEFRSRVKQDRLNKFIESLEQELAEIDIDPKKLQTEENLDLFESIFKKVAETRNEKKRNGLKNILVKGIKQQEQIEYCEIFAELLMSVHPKELELLAAHQPYSIEGKGALACIHELKAEQTRMTRVRQAEVRGTLDSSLQKLVKEDIKKFGHHPGRTGKIAGDEMLEAEAVLAAYKENCTPEKFNMTNDEMKFFLQNLLSKGLLRDDGVGAIGTGPVEIMAVSNLGLKFLDFIKL